MFWKSIISLEKRLEKFSKFAKKRSQTFHKVVKTIRKSFHKRSIMGQKDTFSQVKKKLLFPYFKGLLSSRARKVHCVRRVHRLPSGDCWQESALWQESAYSVLE